METKNKKKVDQDKQKTDEGDVVTWRSRNAPVPSFSDFSPREFDLEQLHQEEKPVPPISSESLY